MAQSSNSEKSPITVGFGVSDGARGVECAQGITEEGEGADGAEEDVAGVVEVRPEAANVLDGLVVVWGARWGEVG